MASSSAGAAGSGDSSAARKNLKRPKYSKFTQQELPACKPILTPDTAIAMDNDLELAIKDAITADDLKRVDQESKDRLLAQEETKLDLDSLENPPPRILGESSTTTHTYRLNSKGLVSEELIKDDTMMVVGLGLSLCNSHDNTKLEINKALRNQKLAHPEAAELAAIIHGLKWALELGVESIQFFCDDSNILGYVTRKAAPNESIVAKLLEQVSLLQTRFTSCQALAVSRDIISVIKLAKDAIASQTRWYEGDTEYESCPVCYAYVSPNDKFEVHGCFHRICVTCMRKPFSSEQLLRGNTAICPYPDCENDLVPEDCRGFADADAITLMIQRKKEKAIPVKDRVYCPNPSCSFLMSDLDLIRHVRNNPRQSEARKCMECGLSFCKKCHVPWHYKKTCDEFKKSESYLKSDAALLESFVKTQGWKKCSQCQSIVQHGGGCKQMTCRHCKHEFCYTCGAACKKKKLTCKCSRSGK